MNMYYTIMLDLIFSYYHKDKDKDGIRLGQYVLDNIGPEARNKMYPIVDGLATDSFVYYETNNVIAGRLLMDTAAAMGDE